jgi:hypothetical protein
MSVSITGSWLLTVLSHEPGQRRFTITGSSNADGTYPGDVGTAVTVQAIGDQSWQLEIENFSGGVWRGSGIRVEGAVGIVGSTDLLANFRSEDDPASTEAVWDDIVLQVRNVDPLIRVPIRPFALRTDDLQMMPDGIFDTSLGTYYLGVRVENTWGIDFAADTHWIGITAASRAALAAAGIVILDTWTSQELESVGQRLNPGGNHVVLPTLARHQSHTVYFKLDCSRASARKYEIEFECVEASMVDPASPRRRTTAKIFVSRSTFDTATGRLNINCPEGRLSLRITRFAAPVTYVLRERRRVGRRAPDKECLDALQKLRELLLSCREIDCSELRSLFVCVCEGQGPGHRAGPFIYPDIPLWPMEFEYTVEGLPFTGTTGPIPFQDPWWKLLLILVAIILSIAAALSDTSDVAYHDDDIVIGTLERWQQNDVDAAVTKLNGKRATPSGDPTEVLDAHSDEPVTTAVVAIDGDVNVDPNFLSSAEISAVTAAGGNDAKVFKSGARSGTTRGIIQSLTTPYTRSDDGTVFNLPQINIVKDPAFNQPTSQHGDSGSVWVQTSSLRLVGLNHSGSADDSGSTAVASLIADVAAALNIKFKPS